MQYPQYPHYVPILKWQAYEQIAVENTYPDVVDRVLPCFEVRTSSQHQSMLTDLDTVWNAPALIDYSNPDGVLTPVRLAELMAFLAQGTGTSLLASPVVSPYIVSADFQAVVAALAGRKIALRLRVDDLTMVGLHQLAITTLMGLPGAKAAVNRLIVDLRCTPTKDPTAAEITTLASTLATMKASGFQHVHLASGSFPESLAHIAGAGEVKRSDWALWKKVAAASPGTLIGYSDYGPMWPKWTEEILERRGGRVVIRYTITDKWRIVRGPSNKKADSIAISVLMATGYAAELKPRTYSFGDQLIHDRADATIPMKNKKCGLYHFAEFWSHHIAFVVKDQY